MRGDGSILPAPVAKVFSPPFFSFPFFTFSFLTPVFIPFPPIPTPEDFFSHLKPESTWFRYVHYKSVIKNHDGGGGRGGGGGVGISDIQF